ncbi:ATP-binding protein [Rhizobium calliandrae]|uniref:histidine kinase n=1 Tax=Rhizobium calliandrae TaxID=1312182 RepID=A0ABT7KD16_9HYPH|nr:ATP-binding protein [Rhizobium calliandrae]MDL2405875.1 ATP-binding protein [Rhizobium calliandrae]
MKRPRLTLLQRLILAMSIVAFVAICASAVFLYFRFQASNETFREETLSTFAENLRHELVADPQLSSPNALALKARIHELRGQYAVVGSAGEIIASSGLQEPLVPYAGDHTKYFQLPAHQGQKTLFGVSLPIAQGGLAGVIQVAFPKEHVLFDSILEEFVGDIAWIWIPFVLILLVTNIVVLGFALRPLRVAAQEAAKIGPSSIATRLTESGMPNDVLALIRSVNAALDRLQGGFLSLEQFSGQLAHELRTPLAIAKARLSLSQDHIARAVEKDFEDVERVITQLVDRVRVRTLHYEATDVVDLGAVAADVARYLAPAVVEAGRNIELRTEGGPVLISGARDFIFRALRNLVENALHHSPENGVITIVVFSGGIKVMDQGSGFPQRRLDGGSELLGETDRKDGLGLGLAIVAETMVAHHGRLLLANLPSGGAVATLAFDRKIPASRT